MQVGLEICTGCSRAIEHMWVMSSVAIEEEE